VRNADKILVRKPEEKRPLGNISIDGEIILKKWVSKELGIVRIQLAQDRAHELDMAINLWIP
jgi:hypothetical protein